MIDVSLLNILVVEDNKKKAARIEELLSKNDFISRGTSVKITVVRSYSSAIVLLGNEFYDAIILDLMLPLTDPEDDENEGTDCRILYSENLYAYIKDKMLFPPLCLFGLTALPKSKVGKRFRDQSEMPILDFNSDQWAQNVKARLETIAHGKVALNHNTMNTYNLDILIITARHKNEFLPISGCLDWCDEPVKLGVLEPQRDNRFGRAYVNGLPKKVGLVCLGEMGLSLSASVSAQLMHMFRPKYFAMLGMCCGFQKNEKRKGVMLGDIVIARETANWEEGKFLKKNSESFAGSFFHNRTILQNPGEDFLQIITTSIERQDDKIINGIKALYEKRDHCDNVAKANINLEKISLHFDTMVSGSSVVNSTSKIKEITDRFPRAAGLDMEAHSIYTTYASSIGSKPRALVVKGVADYGDGTKAKYFQKTASVASLVAYWKLIEICEIIDPIL